jgi:hypothetical protein
LLAPTACTTAYRQRPRYHRASLKQRRGGPRWHADHPRRNRHRRARRPLKAMRCHFGDGAAGPGAPLSAKPLTSFHSALAPPSTGKAIPVTHSASGEVRNSTQWATSWEVPKRGQGVPCKASLCHCSSSGLVGRVIAVGIRPGQTEFTLIRWGPYMTAKLRVKFTTQLSKRCRRDVCLVR